MSFAEARMILASFVCQAPSTEVIEKAVLGLGQHTSAWYAAAPAPEDDGDVLVIQIDSKGAPTATKSELSRRRGKRRKKNLPLKRHGKYLLGPRNRWHYASFAPKRNAFAVAKNRTWQQGASRAAHQSYQIPRQTID